MIRLSFLISCLVFSLSAASQINYEDANRKKLSDIIKTLENKHGVSFSYNNKLVDPYKISYRQGQYSLNQLMDIVFKQTALTYEFIDSSHVVILQESYEGELMCGYLFDSASQLPLSGATISNRDFSVGEVTDETGYFEFILTENDHALLCSYLGFEDIEINMTGASFDKCQHYAMTPTTYLFPEITLTEYLDDGISVTKDANQIVMSPGDMTLLPGNVEHDVMSSLQFLPGISSPTESLDRLHIRGGTPDQNLILWDDIPIYSTSHLFGAINGLNPFMVEKVDVYRNGVSSKYGGRVSGVIDIKSKSAVPSSFDGGIGFNMTQSNNRFEIPLFKKSALFISSRLSLTESWSSPTFESYADKVFQRSLISTQDFEEDDNKVKFNDLTLKWIYYSKKDVFEFSMLGSNNNLEYKTQLPQFEAIATDSLDLIHAGAKIGWTRNWSPRFQSEFLITSSQFTNNYAKPIQRLERPISTPVRQEFKNDLVEGNVILGFNWDFHENKRVRFGYQYTSDEIDLSWKSRNFDVQTENSEFFENSLHALYSDYSMVVPDLLQLDIGLRYHYSDFLNNEYFEPRIGVTANITDNLKLKLSTSKNFQFVSQLVVLNTNQLGLANQIWVVANNTTIPVIEANQWTGGLLYVKDKWTIDGDAYVKELAGITSLSDSFDPTINVPYSTGTARISGIDLLVKRRFKQFKSWVSYSFSKANYEFLSLDSKSFPATYDQRHVLQWVNLYKKNKWEASLGLTFKSGLPFTDALSIENNTINYDALNNNRLGNYLRLDASVLYEFNTQVTNRGYIAASLQNIGDRRNVLARQFRIDRDVSSDDTRLVTFDTIGLGFTPNVSINFIW